ncbi:TPA: hypothetical protein DCE37_13790 [Candidatus Latescibacteria bacterium]|nr:hypothetical protein [Candidatus Latescibacterota bacterium]
MADQVHAGSIFSFNGQGYPIRRLGPRAYGMGGTGRAIVDGQNFSSFNPALLGAFRKPGVYGLFTLQRRNVEDRRTSRAIADGDVTGLKAVFPFRFRGVLTVGIEGLTDTDVTVVDTVGTGGDQHLLGLNGTGGIGAVVIGFGQKVGNRLFLGAQADVMVVGTLTESWSKDLLNESSAFFSLDKVTRSQKGAQFTLGGVFTLGNLSLAGVFKPEASIIQTVRIENRLTTNAITENAQETERDVLFPATYAFGLAYARTIRWMAALDVEYAAWGDTGPGRHDTTEIAAGIQYQTRPGNARGIGRRYDLMAGVYHRSLYFETASGDPVNELGATVGIAFPFSRDSGKFRWTLEVGRRGDKQSHGARETFFKQTFSITGWIQ